MSRALSLIGILVTGTYLFGLAFLFQDRVAELFAMSPNNIGDFLAGVFGPLAILWLILGFFQQGIELRQNTRALELQAEELRNSVEQQKQLVDVSRKQVEAELEVIQFEREQQKIALRPSFIFHGVGGSLNGANGATYSTKIKNLGNNATDVHFSYEPPLKASSLTTVFSWSRGEVMSLEWRYESFVAEMIAILTISYLDASGIYGTQQFEFLPVKSEPFDMVEIKRIAN